MGCHDAAGVHFREPGSTDKTFSRFEAIHDPFHDIHLHLPVCGDWNGLNHLSVPAKFGDTVLLPGEAAMAALNPQLCLDSFP